MRIRERFNQRAPCGARPLHRGAGRCKSDFNPRAPCGARHRPCRPLGTASDFNPRAPCGARPSKPLTTAIAIKNFNPRAPCGARRSGKVVYHPQVRISTHAPLAGCDTFLPDSLILIDISTHAPLAGRDNKRGKATQDDKISTHAPLAGRDSKSVQITMHIFAITDKFQMLLHRMPPVRAFCSFLMQESHADFGCEPPK